MIINKNKIIKKTLKPIKTIKKDLAQGWCSVLPPTSIQTMSRVRNWCFTINNPPSSEWPPIDPTKVRYLIAQLEMGASGTIHWQGYLQLPTNQRLTYVKKLCDYAHWEQAKGTPIENKRYCTKESDRIEGTEIVEFGEMSYSGKRTDLFALRDAVKDGKRLRTIVEDDNLMPTLARHQKFYHTLSMIQMPPINPSRKKILLLGPAGLGKTRFVFDKHKEDPEFFSFSPSNGTVWFDGYDGHKTVLIDDFDGAASKISLNMCLQMLDIYPVRMPVKGAFTWWNPETIYITTNLEPHEWYKFTGREEKYRALLRRFTSVVKFEKLDNGGTRRITIPGDQIMDEFPLKERSFDADKPFP